MGSKKINYPPKSFSYNTAMKEISDFNLFMYCVLVLQNDRLKIFNRELEEKAESSELQINSISSQYRDVLQEKEVSRSHSSISEMLRWASDVSCPLSLG